MFCYSHTKHVLKLVSTPSLISASDTTMYVCNVVHSPESRSDEQCLLAGRDFFFVLLLQPPSTPFTSPAHKSIDRGCAHPLEFYLEGWMMDRALIRMLHYLVPSWRLLDYQSGTSVPSWRLLDYQSGTSVYSSLGSFNSVTELALGTSQRVAVCAVFLVYLTAFVVL